MHTRRLLRMLLIRFEGGIEPVIPQELELSVRERNGDAILLEHRGELAALLRWLGSVRVDDIAIGTEDLRSLYDQFHGPNVADLEAPI
jgi:ABC-2 type transport system ATP-binding protein